jgi:hypothetical protein
MHSHSNAKLEGKELTDYASGALEIDNLKERYLFREPS